MKDWHGTSTSHFNIPCSIFDILFFPPWPRHRRIFDLRVLLFFFLIANR